MTKSKPTVRINEAKLAVQEFIKNGGDVDHLFIDLQCAFNHYANAWDYCSDNFDIAYNDNAEGSFLCAIQCGGTNAWVKSEEQYKIDYSHPVIEHLESVVDAFGNNLTKPGDLISALWCMYGEDADEWSEEILGEELYEEWLNY